MMARFSLPHRGFVHWPVACGDATTIVVPDADGNPVVLQVDLNQLERASEEGAPEAAVVDELLELLPKRDGLPYLAVLAFTHLDKDHTRGAKKLLDAAAADEVIVGELWFTPRALRDPHDDLSEDAKAVVEEVARRVAVAIDASGEGDSGDRIQIFGEDEVLDEEDYANLPDTILHAPGDVVTTLDGIHVSDGFEALIYAPFPGDCGGESNESSLAMRISLFDGEVAGHLILVGDLAYPALRKLFDKYTDDELSWDVLLAPHHCSKSAMYWADEDDPDIEVLHQDILDDIEEAKADDDALIVLSCSSVPPSNDSGDNPPHAKAHKQYKKIASTVLCTMDEAPSAIVIAIDADKGVHRVIEKDVAKASRIPAAVAAVRGSSTPPRKPTGFG